MRKTTKKTNTMNNLARVITIAGNIKENHFSYQLPAIEYDYSSLADQLIANGSADAQSSNAYMQRIFLEDKETYDKIVLRLDGNYSIIEKILDIDFTEYKTLDLDCVDALQQRLRYCRINSKDAYEAYKYLKDGLTDVKADNVAWLLKQSNLYEFNFEDAIDCSDKPYLSATSVNSKDQFSLLSEMCRSDGERLSSLAALIGGRLPNSIFNNKPEILEKCFLRLQDAGIQHELIIRFIDNCELSDEWLLIFCDKIASLESDELLNIISDQTLTLATCCTDEVYTIVKENLAEIRKNSIQDDIEHLLCLGKYTVVQNLCYAIKDGLTFTWGNALMSVLASENIDIDNITVEQIKRLSSINRNVLTPAYTMDCDEYEFLLSIPRKYSLLAESLQDWERDKRISTVQWLLAYNGLAYISKIGVKFLADTLADARFTEMQSVIDVPVPLYVKLCSTVDWELIKQIHSIEDAQFLAWCLPDNVRPSSRIEDLKYGFFTSNLCSIKLQGMFKNLEQRVNTDRLYELCMSRDAKFIIDYLLDKSINKTSKKLLKLALAAQVFDKYDEFRHKAGMLQRELACNVTTEFEQTWYNNLELTNDSITVKECDGFIDTIEFGLDPIELSINIKTGSCKYALPSMFCANRKIVSIFKNDFCIAQAQLILTKVEDYEDDSNSTTIEQSEFEHSELIVLLDSINFINGCDNKEAAKSLPLVIDYLERKAETLGIRPAFVEGSTVNDSYKLVYKKIFISLTRSGCQKFWFRSFNDYYANSEGTYTALNLYMKD